MPCVNMPELICVGPPPSCFLARNSRRYHNPSRRPTAKQEADWPAPHAAKKSSQHTPARYQSAPSHPTSDDQPLTNRSERPDHPAKARDALAPRPPWRSFSPAPADLDLAVCFFSSLSISPTNNKTLSQHTSPSTPTHLVPSATRPAIPSHLKHFQNLFSRRKNAHRRSPPTAGAYGGRQPRTGLGALRRDTATREFSRRVTCRVSAITDMNCRNPSLSPSWRTTWLCAEAASTSAAMSGAAASAARGIRAAASYDVMAYDTVTRYVATKEQSGRVK